MKRINRTGLIILLVCIALNLHAQSETPEIKIKTSQISGLYVGSHASTNGWGVNARYSFNNWLSLKTGYESLNFKTDFNFEEYDISYAANLDYNTGGILALADINYTKNLYVSAGAVFNSFNPELKGAATNDFQYGDIVINAEDIGDFTFRINPGLKVSPYAGAGVLAFIGKKKAFVFNFETGIYYMGSPEIEIEATGLLTPTADPAHGQKEYLESQFDSYKIYPVVKFNLAVKLF